MPGPRLTAVALTCLLVAGCAGGPPAPTQSSAAPATGAIEGRVIDDASAVIEGASIRVLLTSLSAITDAEGAYAIEAVPAGPIRVVASAEGFTSQTKTTTLAANARATLDFVLAPIAVIRPYNETKRFSGTLVCGLPGGAACPSDPQGDPEQSSIVHPFEVATDLRGLILELVWQPPAPNTNPTLAIDIHAASGQGCGARYNGTVGPSVLRLELQDGFPVSGGHQCAVVRPPANQATVQQAYTLYATLFYHASPPSGFSALA